MLTGTDTKDGLPIIDANTAFCALVGMPFEALEQRPLLSHLALETDRDLESVVRSAIAGSPVRIEARIDAEVDGGTWIEMEMALTPAGNELVTILRDITETRNAAEAAQTELTYQATHDPLTHLLNRAELIERLESALSGKGRVTVLFIDLDRFKLVNDSLGHATGDAMLGELARRISVLRDDNCMVARIGGDEFVIGLLGAEQSHSESIADKVLKLIRRTVWVEGHALNTTSSIGISTSTDSASAESVTAEHLLRDADVALYRAKDLGGDQWAWFDEEARRDLLRRVAIERDLHEALHANQLQLYYQPAYDLTTGAATNVESLLRWNHPEHWMISPGHFIPIAEESGLILPIGLWVLRQTLADARKWVERDDVAVWANVSIRQLMRPGLAAQISRELSAARFDPERFGIEITESVLADRSSVINELTEISKLGVRIAIDDFGTGYSSISRLSNLPVDMLKIDQSFIREIELPGGVETVRAIVDLGHALDCLVIAEGVETPRQLELLRQTGCEQAGGYLFSRPVPNELLADAMQAGRRVIALG